MFKQLFEHEARLFHAMSGMIPKVAYTYRGLLTLRSMCYNLRRNAPLKRLGDLRSYAESIKAKTGLLVPLSKVM